MLNSRSSLLLTGTRDAHELLVCVVYFLPQTGFCSLLPAPKQIYNTFCMQFPFFFSSPSFVEGRPLLYHTWVAKNFGEQLSVILAGIAVQLIIIYCVQNVYFKQLYFYGASCFYRTLMSFSKKCIKALFVLTGERSSPVKHYCFLLLDS